MLDTIFKKMICKKRDWKEDNSLWWKDTHLVCFTLPQSLGQEADVACQTNWNSDRILKHQVFVDLYLLILTFRLVSFTYNFQKG